MTTETIELRLEGELYARVAAIANLADVPIEHIVRVALAQRVLEQDDGAWPIVQEGTP